MIAYNDSGIVACLRALPRLPTSWKVSNNPQTTTTLENWHDVVKITESIEQVMDRGKIEGSTMNSKTKKRDELGDDSKGGKP